MWVMEIEPRSPGRAEPPLQPEILPFKEEETDAQGHTARGANQGQEPVPVNFSQELFPVNHGCSAGF